MKIVDAMRNRYHPFGSDSLLGQMILVLSFLMVLILCAVYTVFDRYYVHEYLENRYYFNQLSMEAVQSTMEDKALHVLDNMDQLFETSSINRLVVSGKQSQDAQVISSALTLKKWAAAEENVLSASLLIRDSGMIIQSNQLVLNWEQYESQEEYRDFYVNGTPMRGAVMQDGHLKLYASFPVQQPMAVLSVILDMDQLYGIVTDSRINASAWPLYIYDKDRQEIFRRYTAYPEFEDTALTVESSTGQYQCYRLAQHPSTMVMKGYSSEFGWYFISCIEEHDILPAGIQVFKSVFPFLLFLLLLIGCVSILLIYRVYFPIFTLTRHIQTLLGKNPEPQRCSGNELAYIQNAIDQESQKRQQLQALVSSSSAEIVEKLISTLIRSPVPVPEDRLEILRGLGSAYASPGKFLLLLYCCQENSLDAGDSFSWTLHGYESRERVLQFWMPRCQVQHIPVDGRIQGALLLYPEQTTISHINKDVKLFETVMGGDSKRTCRIAWGWGSVSCDLEGVRSSWADAEQTLNRNIYYFDKKPVGEQGPESAESSGYLPRFCQCLELLINNDPDGEARFQALCGELLSRSPGEVSTLYPTLFDCAMEKG